ncbi:MAG: CvpA family protein [Candidatus Margulisiibacteriota bacterium]
MNYIDITILIILAFSTLRGLMRGLVRAIFDIMAFVFSIWLGSIWYRGLSLYLTNYVKLPGNIMYTIAFVIIFIGIYLITALVGSFLHKLIGRGILGPLNMLGGAIIGFAKGIIVIWIILQITVLFPLPKEASSQIKGSKGVESLKPALEYTSLLIFKMAPKDMHNLNKFIPTMNISPSPADSGRGKGEGPGTKR